MLHAPIEQRLFEALCEQDVIDCHEHLGAEETRTGKVVDLFTLFSFAPYIGFDLQRAGMPEAAYRTLADRDVPLDRRWQTFAPYWEQVRWTSYARSILLGIARFYGETEVTADNYSALSARISAGNTPGLYDRVLRDAGRIRRCLTDVGTTAVRPDLFSPLIRVVDDVESRDGLLHPPFAPTADIRTLDDYLDACRAYIRRSADEGAVGIKIVALEYGDPDRDAAQALFTRLASGEVERLAPLLPWPLFGGSNPLRDYLVDRSIAFAGEIGLVVAVHTGYWGDFRRLNPLFIIPALLRHPEARFDIFHLGYPWIRETLMLGKGFSNVWLNCCWLHIISQQAAVAALDEAIDLLPANKLLAFGGDYGADSVEAVYGHLTMGRENVARVLANRIIAGRMDEQQALGLARQWFFDNPRNLYRLTV